MTNFGAGFFALAPLLVRAGLAALCAVVGIAAVLFHRRSGRVPRALGYVTLVLLAGVVVVTGFGVLALVDEVSVVAVLLVVIVVGPLAAAGASARRFDLPALDVLVTATLAWSLPYVVGFVDFFLIGFGINQLFGLAPGESRSLGVAWYAAAGAGAVAIAGAVAASAYLRRLTPILGGDDIETVGGG